MGYITNQWLLRERERRRGHFPIKAEIHTAIPNDKWSEEHSVVAEIFAYKSDEYQAIYLTQEDLKKSLSTLLIVADKDSCKSLAKVLSKKFNETELLEFVESILQSRRKRK
jgi:hypothetical protein